MFFDKTFSFMIFVLFFLAIKLNGNLKGFTKIKSSIREDKSRKNMCKLEET